VRDGDGLFGTAMAKSGQRQHTALLAFSISRSPEKNPCSSSLEVFKTCGQNSMQMPQPLQYFSSV
jgi:hypothetical protein